MLPFNWQIFPPLRFDSDGVFIVHGIFGFVSYVQVYYYLLSKCYVGQDAKDPILR